MNDFFPVEVEEEPLILLEKQLEDDIKLDLVLK